MAYPGGRFEVKMAAVRVTVEDKRAEKTKWAKFRLGLHGWFSDDYDMELKNGKWEGKAPVSTTTRYIVVYGSNFQHVEEWSEDLADTAQFVFILS